MMQERKERAKRADGDTTFAPQQRTKPSAAQPRLSRTQPSTMLEPYGNQARQRLLHSISIQPKLNISTPGDEYEQEADRVAETVMRMPDPNGAQSPAINSRPADAAVQRLCQECEEEEDDDTVQAKEVTGHHPQATPHLQAQVSELRGGGYPLPESERRFFEPRFGKDFSRVRLHTDARAAESARSINALAYTVGHDIVFGSQQYAPQTIAGRRLLSHELAHTIQQQGIVRKAAGQRSSQQQAGERSHSTADVINRGLVSHRAAPFIARQQPAGSSTTIETINIVGDPNFYPRAQRGNQYYAAHPPRPGWPYDETLRQLWLNREFDNFADAVREYQANFMGMSSRPPDGILGPGTAESLRTRPMQPGPQPQTAAGDPVEAIRQNPDYVERRVIAVGIHGWGGPFRLVLEVNAQQLPTRAFYMPREMFALGADPFTGNAEMALISTIYASLSAAQEAVRTSALDRPGFVTYAFYRGNDNIIYPTIMSATTTPYLIQALRSAIAQEANDARAASNLLINAFLTATGMRYLPSTAAPTPRGGVPAAAATAGEELAALRGTAQRLIGEARQAGGRVRVNLGGTGEVADAINVNPLRDQQVMGVPRLVRTTAERIGEVFPSGSVDEIISNNVVSGQLNWAAACRGAFQILRSGGRVTISPYTGDIAAHMAEIEAALTQAGFRNISRVHEVIITAIRP